MTLRFLELWCDHYIFDANLVVFFILIFIYGLADFDPSIWRLQICYCQPAEQWTRIYYVFKWRCQAVWLHNLLWFRSKFIFGMPPGYSFWLCFTIHHHLLFLTGAFTLLLTLYWLRACASLPPTCRSISWFLIHYHLIRCLYVQYTCLKFLQDNLCFSSPRGPLYWG